MPTNHDETLHERYEREHRQMEKSTTTLKADEKQDWKGMDGATAFLLIQRHADGWDEVGEMMTAWLRTNTAPQPAQASGYGQTLIPQVSGFDTQAQQPLTFAGVAKRKLDELQTQGYSVVGYMLARLEADHTVTRGAIDTGGMVIWWNQQKASQPNG